MRGVCRDYAVTILRKGSPGYKFINTEAMSSLMGAGAREHRMNLVKHLKGKYNIPDKQWVEMNKCSPITMSGGKLPAIKIGG